MTRYYVNKNAQSGGEHEVHTSDCSRLPNPENRINLGRFYTCQAAVREAGKHYASVDGCYYCSRSCHSR